MSYAGKAYDPNTVVITGLPERRKPVWNRRYLAYCRSQGHPDPDKMLNVDRERHPGGCMAGFIAWTHQHVKEFRSQHPEAFMYAGLVDHEGYTKFLIEKYPIVG